MIRPDLTLLTDSPSVPLKGAASINSVATAEDNKYYWDSFDLNEGGADQDNTSHQAGGSQSHLPQAMPLLSGHSGNHVGTGQQVGLLAIIFKFLSQLK